MCAHNELKKGRFYFKNVKLCKKLCKFRPSQLPGFTAFCNPGRFYLSPLKKTARDRHESVR
jgi:hypothetical protein